MCSSRSARPASSRSSSAMPDFPQEDFADLLLEVYEAGIFTAAELGELVG